LFQNILLKNRNHLAFQVMVIGNEYNKAELSKQLVDELESCVLDVLRIQITPFQNIHQLLSEWLY